MSTHDLLTTLRQLREFAEEATSIAEGHSRAELDVDLRLRRHAERIVELMGEACNRLPDKIQAEHPEIPWHQIVGMRNWLAHGYDGIDYDILWDTISRNARELPKLIEPLLREAMAQDRQLERDISDDL